MVFRVQIWHIAFMDFVAAPKLHRLDDNVEPLFEPVTPVIVTDDRSAGMSVSCYMPWKTPMF